MIELENIRKHYTLNGKDVPILKGISVFVGQGEFVSIMGPSGSGKSTLSAILGCLSTPTSGTYKIGGQDVTKLSANKIARLRNSSIGFIFQDFNLLSGLSALENVALPLVYGGMNAKERKHRALACLTKVGLAAKAGNRPSQLSGGQKQRVAIARALVNDPKFLFADEPTGALDKKTGHEILGIMQRLNMAGHTVIQVTHSPLDATYSKRILHLVDGNIIRDEMVEKPTIGTANTEEFSSTDEIAAKLWRIVQLAPSGTEKDMLAFTRLIAASTSRESHLAAVRALVRWGTHDIENTMNSLFQSSDWVIRAEVIKYSHFRPQALALPFYLRGLIDPNAWVRHSAIVELKNIPQSILKPAEQEAVLNCLNDADERVRATAIYMIGTWDIADKKSIFVRAFQDRDSRVRANAVEAISSEVFQKELLKDLITLTQDRNNRVRANAALIVARFQPDIATTTAREMLNAADPLTRSSGAWLVGTLNLSFGGDALLELLKNEKDDIVINQVIKSLAKLAGAQCPLYEQIQKTLGLGEGLT